MGRDKQAARINGHHDFQQVTGGNAGNRPAVRYQVGAAAGQLFVEFAGCLKVWRKDNMMNPPCPASLGIDTGNLNRQDEADLALLVRIRALQLIDTGSGLLEEGSDFPESGRMGKVAG